MASLWIRSGYDMKVYLSTETFQVIKAVYQVTKDEVT